MQEQDSEGESLRRSSRRRIATRLQTAPSPVQKAATRKRPRGTGVEKANGPRLSAEQPQDSGQKMLRRSPRFSSAQKSPQARNNTIYKHAQVPKQGLINHISCSLGGRSNTIQQGTAIPPATHHIPFISPAPPNHRTDFKQPGPRESPQKRPRGDDTHAPPERTLKRPPTSVPPIQNTFKEARIEFWTENGSWPTAEEEARMDHFRDLVSQARASKRSLSRKRSNASMTSDTTPTGIEGSMSRDQKDAPYKHPLFEHQLKAHGSFMHEHALGITVESEKLCQKLLDGPQAVPQDALFSDDVVFRNTCIRMKSENKTKITERLSRCIVPSAEVLADKGVKHLAIVRETTNECWINSKPFINPPVSGPGSQSGPRPQPDFGSGFDRDAFNAEQLQKLQPFFGDLLTDFSLFAVTYQKYFPFLTCEVKCGGGGLDVADRQNAYSQSIILRGMYSLFQLVGREKELHRQINGFSLSHNEENMRIWGHYAVIDGKDVKFYRHLITKFIFAPSGVGDQRWTAYNFVKNVYDLWLPDHFKRICSAIDRLPADLNFDDHYLKQLQSSGTNPDSSRSGMRQ